MYRLASTHSVYIEMTDSKWPKNYTTTDEVSTTSIRTRRQRRITKSPYKPHSTTFLEMIKTNQFLFSDLIKTNHTQLPFQSFLSSDNLLTTNVHPDKEVQHTPYFLIYNLTPFYLWVCGMCWRRRYTFTIITFIC